MTRKLLSVAALVVALLTLPQLSVTAAKPSGITDLGTLGGDYSDAFGINNDPTVLQVVGQSTTADGPLHAFFWTPSGPMMDLGTLGGRDSHAEDINNHGQIVGGSEDASQQRWAVVWTMSGGGWVVDILPTLTGACCADGRGINNGTGSDPLAVAVRQQFHQPRFR